jgi:alkylated DNA repair dioxygenase AlkB
MTYTGPVGLPSAFQRGLFDPVEPGFDPDPGTIQRVDLGRGAWVEHAAGWLRGHEAVLETVWSTTRWRTERRMMYDREVDVPRLFASLPDDGPGHPILPEVGAALGARYGRPLLSVSMAAYRHGRDSVAFHGDRLGRHRDDAIVAIVSLGEPRRFLLRPAGGGPSRAFTLGAGDLIVMGGTCQRTWEHAVPKVARAGLRISVQFRSVPDDG